MWPEAVFLFFSSMAASGPLVQEMMKREEATEEPAVVEPAVVEQAMQELNSQLGDPLTYEEVGNKSQREVSALIDSEAATRLFRDTEETRDRARLNCVAREGAGDWLTALPSKALGLHLRSGEFILAARFRLGLPVFRQAGECPMPRCTAHSDMFGFHAIVCATGSLRIAKHNHLRDAIFDAAQQAHLGPLKEPDGLLPGSDDRPGDIVLPFWDNGRDVCLDVCVVSPQQVALVQQAAREGGGDVAVKHAFKAKMRKYEDRCAAEGLSFLPLAVDSYGGWHARSLEALTKLGRQVARVVGKREDEAVMQLRQRAAVLHVRDSVEMIRSRCPTVIPAEIDGDE
jgi:hypothetical protein